MTVSDKHYHWKSKISQDLAIAAITAAQKKDQKTCDLMTAELISHHAREGRIRRPDLQRANETVYMLVKKWEGTVEGWLA